MSNMIETLDEAQKRNSRFAHARQKYLFSTVDLAGFADSTGKVAQQRLAFFIGKVGSVAQGFNRSMHSGLTNFTGGNNTMPNGDNYVGKAFGVRIVTRQDFQSPRHVIAHLTSGSTSVDIRRSDSTAHDMGPIELWPAGRFGASNRAIHAIGAPPAGGAVTLYDAPQNGDAGLRILEDGSEIIFKGGDLVDVGINIHDEFYLTDNGLPASTPADIRRLWLQVIFDGYSMSKVAG